MYKVMLSGEPGTGKSCFLKYINNYISLNDRTQKVPQIEKNHYPTVGLEVGVHTVELNEEEFVNIQIWDTTGDHSYHRICDKYYNDVNTFVIFIDCTDSGTLQSLSYWLTKIRQNRTQRSKYSVFVIANKAEVADRKFQSSQFKQQYLKEIEITGYEQISLKTGINVHKAMLLIAKLACNGIPSRISKHQKAVNPIQNQNKQPICNCLIM